MYMTVKITGKKERTPVYLCPFQSGNTLPDCVPSCYGDICLSSESAWNCQKTRTHEAASSQMGRGV